MKQLTKTEAAKLQLIARQDSRAAELMKAGKFDLQQYELALNDWGELFNRLPIRSMTDVFDTGTPSVAVLKKYIGQEASESILYGIIKQCADFINIGKNMKEPQIRMTSSLIVQEFSRMTIADFKLFFTRLMTGKYGEFYDRFDGQLILVKMREYWKERLEAAQAHSEKLHSQSRGNAHEVDKDGLKKIAAIMDEALKKMATVKVVKPEIKKPVIPGSKARLFKSWDYISHPTQDKGTIKPKDK